ncbi:hypothetical protein SNEBB_000710 [Seison nebaliae]|nr:hypothetical protein SNEBB_000710 [Seison nebaliae]
MFRIKRNIGKTTGLWTIFIFKNFLQNNMTCKFGRTLCNFCEEDGGEVVCTMGPSTIMHRSTKSGQNFEGSFNVNNIQANSHNGSSKGRLFHTDQTETANLYSQGDNTASIKDDKPTSIFEKSRSEKFYSDICPPKSPSVQPTIVTKKSSLINSNLRTSQHTSSNITPNTSQYKTSQDALVKKSMAKEDEEVGHLFPETFQTQNTDFGQNTIASHRSHITHSIAQKKASSENEVSASWLAPTLLAGNVEQSYTLVSRLMSYLNVLLTPVLYFTSCLICKKEKTD